jgi:hypothetical protein
MMSARRHSISPANERCSFSVIAEDKIHWGLLLATATLAGAVFLRPAATSDDPSRARKPRAVSIPAPSEVNREQLERAITRLKKWVESAASRVRGPVASSLAFQGLGHAGLVPAPTSAALGSLFSSTARSPAEDDRMAALAILIEGGVPLERELPIPPETLSVQELVERTLATSTPPGEPNAWELDLLSLLSLRGVTKYHERLAHLTHASLRQLDLGSRDSEARPSGAELDVEQLRQRAEAWRAAPENSLAATRELQLSMATFRAIGVLHEPALELQARLHVRRLLSRYGPDRALYEYLVTTSLDAAERTRARLEAVEYFGRLEQVLYGAHLAFRRQEHPEPEGRARMVMRQAASDLVAHFHELDEAGVFAAGPAANLEDGALLRAAVHALRGLRTARSAAGS